MTDTAMPIKRPLSITIICVIVFFGALVSISPVFAQTAEAVDNQYRDVPNESFFNNKEVYSLVSNYQPVPASLLSMEHKIMLGYKKEYSWQEICNLARRILDDKITVNNLSPADLITHILTGRLSPTFKDIELVHKSFGRPSGEEIVNNPQIYKEYVRQLIGDDYIKLKGFNRYDHVYEDITDEVIARVTPEMIDKLAYWQTIFLNKYYRDRMMANAYGTAREGAVSVVNGKIRPLNSFDVNEINQHGIISYLMDHMGDYSSIRYQQKLRGGIPQ